MDENDAALDSVVALLSSYGKHALDTDVSAEEIRRECEAWVTRIAIGNAEEADGPHSGRNWKGLRHFFERTRSEETEFVGRSLTNLREALRQFVVCLDKTLVADHSADTALSERLEALEACITANDPERIKSSACEVVRLARRTFSERREREARHAELLRNRLSQVRADLLEARSQAILDGLTQLYNRKALDEHLDRIADWGVLFDHPPALLLLDVDHFKRVNDTLGHGAGDTVIKGVADSLTRTFLRRQDFVARYGGEEFAAVVVDTPRDRLLTMAGRLLQSLRDTPFVCGATPVLVTVSVGLAELRQGERPDSWLERADRALYKAKEAGRNQLVTAE